MTPSPTPHTIGRTLLIRQIVGLAAIAIAATTALGFHIAGARTYEAGRRGAELAAELPILVARAGPLAAITASETAAPGERIRARAELDRLLNRIEVAHEEIAFAATRRRLGSSVEATRAAMLAREVEEPLLDFIGDARALVAMAEFSPAGAARRLRVMRESEVARLAAQLARIARMYDSRQHAMVQRQARLSVAMWLALLAVIVGAGVFALPANRRAQIALADAQSRAKLALALRRARLPLSAAPDAQPHVGASAALLAPETPAPAPTETAPEAAPEDEEPVARVLMFVRDAELREHAREQLEALSLEVATVGDFDEARRRAGKGDHDILVLDSGSAIFAGRLKCAAAPAHVPCVALAGPEEDARALHARGCDVIASAPFSPNELEVAVAFALRARPPARRAA